jgi:cell fate regulator YaaT (PSP1 superfamily)
VRDEAGIIGGIGPCGRTLCCCTWLRHFESINVKMAKAQRVSLNPTSMSGSCGRLKCCMRYEYDVYRDLTRGLPRNGSVVECPDGRGMVLGTNILAQRVKVQLDDERIVEYAAGEVKEERTNPGKGGRMMDENPGHKRTESGAAGEARARRIRRDKP